MYNIKMIQSSTGHACLGGAWLIYGYKNDIQKELCLKEIGPPLITYLFF